jgi:cell division protein FtsI (penicillin-binding protein 3)
VFTVFGGRLVQLQGLDASALAAKALASRLSSDKLPAHRGDILDTTGVTLATSFDRVTITIDQRLVPQYHQTTDLPDSQKGVAGAAAALAPILGLSMPDLVTKLTGSHAFAYLVKNVEPQVWNNVAKLGIPGLIPESTTRRTYPGNQVAASVIGFVGSDGTPLSGVERTYNAQLKGTDGELSYERGKGGQAIATGVSSEIEPVSGQNVQLTIDADLQYRAQEALDAAVKSTDSKSGTAVILDPRTGDVLALADAPTFNANDPGAAPAANLGNRALTDVFEPGSTSKVITAAAALQEGIAKPSTRVTVPPTLERGAGEVFHDAEVHGTEKLTFAGVLAQSSNIGTIKVGEKLPPATMYDYLTKFGIGSRTGVGLTESPGILAPSSQWDGRQRYTVLFGQGLSVTSLQSAEVFATIANNGVRVAPRLIKAVGPDGAMQSRPEGAKTRVISRKAATQLREMLEGVVGAEGTAEKATIPGYRVAGKTGTAQAYDPKCNCYNGYTASFVGMAPADKPRLVVAVFLQQPTNGHFGGSIAAPVFQQVMTYALQHEGIAPTGTKAPKVPVYWH